MKSDILGYFHLHIFIYFPVLAPFLHHMISNGFLFLYYMSSKKRDMQYTRF